MNGHIQSLSRTLSQPWMARREYTELRNLEKGLNDAMYTHNQYLVKKSEEIRSAQKKSETMHKIEENRGPALPQMILHVVCMNHLYLIWLKNIITKRSTLMISPWRTDTPDDIGSIY